MSEEILRQRAQIYARGSEKLDERRLERCLEVHSGDRRWLLPEQEVEVLLSSGEFMSFPAGVQWREWRCRGLLSYALQPLPVLAWSDVIEESALQAGVEASYLVLRGAQLALAVPGIVSLAFEDLRTRIPEDDPWSLGRLPTGASILDVGRLFGDSD